MDSKTNGSIGVQQILPRTGTSWQGQSLPCRQSRHDGQARARATAAGKTRDPSRERGATPRRAVGKIVDKIGS